MPGSEPLPCWKAESYHKLHQVISQGGQVNLSEAKWFKSSRSGPNQDCVEAAFLDDGSVGLRDSKNPGGPALVLTPSEWDAFTLGVQAGGLDHI